MNYWGIFFLFGIIPFMIIVGLYLCYLTEDKAEEGTENEGIYIAHGSNITLKQIESHFGK